MSFLFDFYLIYYCGRKITFAFYFDTALATDLDRLTAVDVA